MLSCSKKTSTEEKAYENKSNPVETNFGDGVGSSSQLNFTSSFPRNWGPIGHDGNPYVTNRFKIYSDKASLSIKKKMASYAETALDGIFKFMSMSDHDDYKYFKFNSGFTARRIHIMADFEQQLQGGRAYRDGVVMRSIDSPRYFQFWSEAQYRHTIRHEIYHVIEFLLIGNPSFQQANSVWFREGGANYGAQYHRIQKVSELSDWKDEMSSIPGKGNPTLIQVWSDFPKTIIDTGRTVEYYGFFELTVRYLLDPVGAGGNHDDLKKHYADLGKGIPFATSLANNFGISLSNLQINWFSLMDAYLKNPNRINTKSIISF